MKAEKAPASAHWSIAAYLLTLAATACVLSTGASLMAPTVVRENLWADGLLGLAVVGVLYAAALWFSSRLKLPLRDLAAAAGDVVKGHLDARVPARRCPRELAKLSAEFNQMMQKLQQTEAELQAAKGELEERVAARTTELITANRELEAFAGSSRYRNPRLAGPLVLLKPECDQCPAPLDQGPAGFVLRIC